jgi:hypothetical protein
MNPLRRFALISLILSLPVQVFAARRTTNGVETNNLSTTSVTEWSTTSSGTPTVVTTPVHSGTYALEINPSASTEWMRFTQTADTAGTYWTRFYFRCSALPGANTRIYTNASTTTGTNNHQLVLNTTGTLVLTNVPTAGTITSTTTLAANTWYSIGIKHLLSDTVGTLELFIDGTSEGTPIATGDTLNLNVGRWFMGVESSGTITAYYDDIIVNDETGSAPFNDAPTWVSKLAMLKPTSDNTVTFTKTGANCSATTITDCVDDEPGLPDETSGYAACLTCTSKVDQLNPTTLPAEVTSDADMISVDVRARMGGLSTVGTNTGRLKLWDESAAITNGPTVNVCDVNGWRDPGDSTATGWVGFALDLGTRTKANVDTFDWGYEAVSTNQTCAVTALWAMVEWIEAAAPGTSTGPGWWGNVW